MARRAPKFLDMCTILTLPREKLAAAAVQAVEINPANEPGLRFQSIAFAAEAPPSFALVHSSKKWDRDRTLTVGFLNGSSESARLVQKYAEEWLTASNSTLKFSFVGSASGADIRIRFNAGGHNSALGTDLLQWPKIQPTMNFGWDPATYARQEEVKRVVMHEFGHALGFVHEHQRPDRPLKFNVPVLVDFFRRTQKWDEGMVRSQILDPVNDTSTANSTEFDPKSIMAYAIPKEALLEGPGIDWNWVLSDLDIKLMTEVYGKVKEPPVKERKLKVGGAPVKFSLKAGQKQVCSFQIEDPGLYLIRTHSDLMTVMDVYGPDDKEKYKVPGYLDSNTWDSLANPWLTEGTWYAVVKFRDQSLDGEMTVSVNFM
jgi:hypothetical protein